MDDVFSNAFGYLSVLTPSIFALTIVALADELFLLIKRSVKAANVRSRRR